MIGQGRRIRLFYLVRLNRYSGIQDKVNVLLVPNGLVVKRIIKLKNSSVPDNIKPATIKVLFGGIDLMNQLG